MGRGMTIIGFTPVKIQKRLFAVFLMFQTIVFTIAAFIVPHLYGVKSITMGVNS